jgi:hypothetical protein
VKAQKRFISTIARRLDTMGAITRGQRQTGGQNMFRAHDNLESFYARDALRQLYMLIVRGKVEGCSLLCLRKPRPGLSLLDAEGGIRDELPPITTFLNRMLALTIDLQDISCSRRSRGCSSRGSRRRSRRAAMRSASRRCAPRAFIVTDRRTIYTHPGTGAETQLADDRAD